jgi:tRNA pseudouridine13 synthase
MKVPDLESFIGMKGYATESKGVGGRIRMYPKDFIVEEILMNGLKASFQLTNKSSLTSGHGRYLICLLIKKGWDTFFAVRELAYFLGIKTERINFAGIKDAKAITAQHISIGYIDPKRFKMYRIDQKERFIKVIPVHFSSYKISSNLLFGNHFNIILRSQRYNFTNTLKEIRNTHKKLADMNGILNFFGHQRFGTVRPITHKVGYYILKEKFEEAVFLYLLKTSPYEHPQIRNAREYLKKSRDYKSCLKYFPRNLIYERQMIKYLSKYPKDFCGALSRLPQNLCRFFVEAYQSYLFNLFLSERIRRGISNYKAQNGDYILTLNEKGLKTDDFRKAEKHNLSKINREIQKGKSMIAIPLIGFQQQSSSGIQGEIENEILKNEGISPKDFCIKKMKKASSAGILRLIKVPILDFGFEEIKSNLKDEPLFRFRFTLHKGSYATIVLREFMKTKNLIKSGY